MYPVTILRAELICLVILVFLYFTSRSYNVGNESKTFSRILVFALIHVVFDFITVLTVNNTSVVPAWINWICHVIFYLSAILYSNELCNFVFSICYPNNYRKYYFFGFICILLYVCCLPFLKIDYVADVGTYSSTGPAAYVGYGLAFGFFTFSLFVSFWHWKKLPSQVKRALIPMMIVLMITEVCQILFRSVLFTGGAITIVTVGFFFSLENPVEVFRNKAMVDALTGVRSRSSFEEDIEKYDILFKRNPNTDYIYVFCDINDLRDVNNKFGHSEGDNYIILISSALIRCMSHAASIYRIGGDEFLVFYNKTSEIIVEKDISDLKNECVNISSKIEYTAGVSVGYAVSSSNYTSLRDVVKTADYLMYQNKASKANNSVSSQSTGTRLNYSGLTEKTFDLMCSTNESSYPFITNMSTNVTRIAPLWKEYFGLDSEFFFDFISSWKDRIHPDYLEGYLEDVAATINGHQKYHYYDYLAKRADGEYILVSCYGSVYRDSSSGTSFFTGFIVNHGLDNSVDPVTDLNNFDALSSLISKRMDNGEPFTLLKLKLNNFSRVNMLYGYSGGNKVLKKIAEILTDEAKNLGDVFCQNSTNFTLLLNTCDKQLVEKLYSSISNHLASGVEFDLGSVPILISGGAVRNCGERREIELMRGGLVFAVDESHYYQRNKLIFYSDFDNTSDGKNISLLAKIHADALDQMLYFQLRYQPIVEISSGKTIGAEALLRWIHPVYGEIPPSQFIDFIENDPCFYRLGLAIINQAVKDSKTIISKLPQFRINVNITALQLQNENFANDVCELLNKYDFPANQLVLELTERCKEMDSSFLRKKIADLRSRGLLVAFDDLGTGYSTLNLLMDIPIDEIKLDRDFVTDIMSRDNYKLFVNALVIGSNSYGNNYTICFEGIENEEIYNEVKNFGDFLAQGYLFEKPLLFDDFSQYIDNQTK